MVEVTFTVSPRVRRIAAHDPDDAAVLANISARSSGVPASTCPRTKLRASCSTRSSLEHGRAAARREGDPVAAAAGRVRHRLRAGDARRRSSSTSRASRRASARTCRWSSTSCRRPTGTRGAAARAAAARRSRTAPTCACCRPSGSPDDELHDLLGKRRPFLTAKRLLTNQTFRDIYRTDTLDVDQRLKITSLTFLFTDLKGSTELYERVGDLVAFDLVRAHFRVLHEIVAAEAGAVVKTIGDAVMATFPTPDRAVAAALRMREAMRELNDERRQRGPAAQDRHPRGALPRRHAERAPGLFRPDRQHRLARAGPAPDALDLRDGAGRRQSQERRGARQQRPQAVAHSHPLRGVADELRSTRSPEAQAS